MLQVFTFPDTYRPQFSGHDTFPLRYGWLKKAYDEVVATSTESDSRSVFTRDDAIARFGVGKNMVNSIRHWSYATRVLKEDDNSHSIQPTEIGSKLFGKNGKDPYLEHPTSIWLIHWQLAAHLKKTTWFWAFNRCPRISFDREYMVESISRLVKQQNWRAAKTTIKNDVACLIRTYVSQKSFARVGIDDALESPLTELNLIEIESGRERFRFVRGAKPTLSNGIFTYALLDFWHRKSNNTTTLSLEAIVQAPYSPGRVFLMNENDVIDRLSDIELQTKGKFRWSETAGLKQVVRVGKVNWNAKLKYIDCDYE